MGLIDAIFTSIKSLCFITLLICLSLTFSSLSFSSPDQETEQAEKKYSEAKLKAAVVFNFMRFIQWQKAASRTGKLCLITQSPDYLQAFSYLSGKTVKQTTIQLAHLTKDDLDINTPQTNGKDKCQVLFTTKDKHSIDKKTLNKIVSKDTLTISESDNGIKNTNTMINLINHKNRVAFEIDLTNINPGLLIPSQVLRLAKEVIQ